MIKIDMARVQDAVYSLLLRSVSSSASKRAFESRKLILSKILRAEYSTLQARSGWHHNLSMLWTKDRTLFDNHFTENLSAAVEVLSSMISFAIRLGDER